MDTYAPSIDVYCSFADYHLYLNKPATVASILTRINTVSKERVGRRLVEGVDKFLLDRTFTAAAQRIGHTSTKRLPLTIDILAKMKPEFRFSEHDDRALWAILCLGVFTLARMGELTPGSASKLI